MNNYDKREIFKFIKGMTLEDFIALFNATNINDNKKQNIIEEREKDDIKILYTIDELIETYPFFTRYNINKSIQNDGLPYCLIGNKRMFSKEEVDKWLDREMKKEKIKTKYDI